MNCLTSRQLNDVIGMLCPADSTPSDNSLSPLTDDTKVDDDIIITSPNKSRTTEDLFAMIHRCVTFRNGIPSLSLKFLFRIVSVH